MANLKRLYKNFKKLYYTYPTHTHKKKRRKQIQVVCHDYSSEIWENNSLDEGMKKHFEFNMNQKRLKKK